MHKYIKHINTNEIPRLHNKILDQSNLLAWRKKAVQVKIEDIPPEIIAEIIRWSRRTTHDTKWITGIKLNPDIEKAYIMIVENALKMGCVKGYEMGIEGLKEDNED